MNYQLLVYHGDAITPTETLQCAASSDVLDAIPRLLAKHPDCARIAVLSGATLLYSVDCKGVTIPRKGPSAP